MIGIATLLRVGAPYALAAAAGGALVLFAPPIRVLGFGFDGGALARLGDARSAREKLERDVEVLTGGQALVEALRERDEGTAVMDADELTRACAASVEAARASAAVISTIITTEPTYDATGCPVRELVPADRLRGLFEPADPDGDAGGVSSEPAG